MTKAASARHLSLVQEDGTHEATDLPRHNPGQGRKGQTSKAEPTPGDALASLREFTGQAGPRESNESSTESQDTPSESMGWAGRLRQKETLRLYAATAGMLLLPVAYVCVLLVGTLCLYLHATLNSSLLSSSSLPLFRAAAYAFPFVAGIPLLILLAKPLLPRRRPRTMARALTRDEQPHLHAFIDTLCEHIGAPAPSSIWVDMELNAVAHFQWRPFSADQSRINLGLPVVAGVDLKSFSGILAHEIGHLKQGSELTRTHLVRSINDWFHRAVNHRDSLDARLETWRRSHGAHGSAIADLVGSFVLMARGLLESFLAASQTLSCYIVRRAEFEADGYEAKLVGAKAFGETIYQLRKLECASNWVHQLSAYTYDYDILPDDLAGFTAKQSDSLSEAALNQLQETIDDAETERHDTHPSDRERIIRAGEIAELTTSLDLPGQASQLFENFEALCREVTLSQYQAILSPNIGFHQLVPSDAVVSRYRAATDVAAASARYFGSFLPRRGVRRLFFPSWNVIPQFRAETLSSLYKSRHRVKRFSSDAHKGYARLAQAQLHFGEIAEIAIAKELGLVVSDETFDRTENELWDKTKIARATVSDGAAMTREFENALSARLLQSFAALQHPTVIAKLPDGISNAFAAKQALDGLKALKELSSWMEELETEFSSTRAILDGATLYGLSPTNERELARRRFKSFERLPKGGDSVCPLGSNDHQTVRDYLLTHRHEGQGRDYQDAGQILGAYYHLHQTWMGQLAMVAEAVEDALSLKSLELNAAAQGGSRASRFSRVRKYRRRFGTGRRAVARA